MCRDLSVSISEKMYHVSGSILRITRYFGLCPLTVTKQGSKLLLRWSPRYLIYSIVFGVITIIVTYMGYFADANIGKERSIRCKTRADTFVTFFDISAVVSVVFCGIFITPFKFLAFCNFVNCFNEIDARIPQAITRYPRYLSIVVICSVLALVLFFQILDTAMYFHRAAEDTNKYFIIKCYSFFYLCYLIMLANLCQYWHLVYGILRRLKLLNEHLNIENFITSPPSGDFNIPTLPVANTQIHLRKAAEIQKRTPLKIELSISKYMVVYEKICDAADILNDLFGFNCALLIVGVLWHLIITFYGLIQEVSGERKDPFYILMMSAWNFIHFMRLLFIAEPCYSCLLEAQKTKNLVCSLLSSTEVNSNYKPKFQEFALILSNRKFEFTATGLATINRNLVTSIIGAVTTYLVILLQFTQSVTFAASTTEATITSTTTLVR